jgi:hypothetical protein
VGDAAAEALRVNATLLEGVVLTVVVFDTDIERVPLADTVDVREDVVVLDTAGELVVDPVKLVEIDDEILGLPVTDSVALTEAVSVSRILRVKEG